MGATIKSSRFVGRAPSLEGPPVHVTGQARLEPPRVQVRSGESPAREMAKERELARVWGPAKAMERAKVMARGPAKAMGMGMGMGPEMEMERAKERAEGKMEELGAERALGPGRAESQRWSLEWTRAPMLPPEQFPRESRGSQEPAKGQ
jgi:hypothetical protein